MKKAILGLLLAAVAFFGSIDPQYGDSRFPLAGESLRGWKLVPNVVLIKSACAGGLVLRTGGGPCGSAPATTYTLTGPSSFTLNQSTTNFTVQPVGTLSSPVTITPSDGGHGGSFSPASVTMSGAGAQTFTYKALQVGTFTISTTNGGSLTNPSGISVTSPNAAPGYPAMTGGTWAINNDSTFLNAVAGDPFGGANASSLTEGSATNYHSAINQAAFTLNANQQYTISFFVKQGTGTRNIDIWLMNGPFSEALAASFNPSACAFVTDQSFGGPTIVSHSTTVIGSWCLAQFSGTLGNFTTAFIQLILDTGTAINYTGDGVSTVDVYGPVVQ